MHFGPTSCSLLNLVERFFALITTRRNRRGALSSVRELERAIRDYLRVHNEHPKPFKWTATVQNILDKVVRCREVHDSLHKRAAPRGWLGGPGELDYIVIDLAFGRSQQPFKFC